MHIGVLVGVAGLHLLIKGARILVMSCMLFDVAMAIVLEPHSSKTDEKLKLAHRKLR
jgi:hypothetical protein